MKSLLVYKASAGSGKTFTLAVEYIKLLIVNPYAYRNILAVTFTNKATAEMKVRILGQLNGIAKSLKSSEGYFEKVKEAPEVKQLGFSDEQIRRQAQKALSLMLHDYSRFRITTIDSFFQSIVRELAYELDLTANLRVDLNSQEALAEAVKGIVDDINHYADDNERKEKKKLLGILMNFMFERIASDKSWNVLDSIEAFSGNIFKEQYLKQQAEVRENIGDIEVLERVKADLNKIKGEAEGTIRSVGVELLTAFRGKENGLKWGASGIYGVAKRFSMFRIGESYASVLKARGMEFLENVACWVKDESLLPEFERLGLYEKYCNAAAYFEKNSTKWVTTQLLLLHINEMMLLNTVNAVLRQKNRENNRFILADTAHFLREMIDDFDVPFIYERTGTRYKHIMIDEFQDTSELQWENFRPLLHNSLADDSRCLIVGDVKQSIYRWRNSDWRTLNDMEHGEFQEKITLPPLDTNYRSSEQVVNFNNDFFQKAARFISQKYNEATTLEDGSNAGEDRAHAITTAYKEVVQKVPKAHRGYGYVRVDHLPYPDKKSATPDDAQGVPNTSDATGEPMTKVEMQLERFGVVMNELLERGVHPNDIAVLVRRKKDGVLIADYLEEHFPHVKVVSNEAFLLESSLAVSMIVSALRVLANPLNDVERYALATLYHREVVCKIHDVEDANAIFSMSKAQVESLLPFGDEASRHDLVEMPLYELCERLYGIMNLHVIDGQDAYLYSFYDYLLKFLQDNRGTLDTFLTYWDETLHEVAVPMGTVEGLQIMTIHKSKGLEFHTVIVPFCDWQVNGLEGNKETLLWCAPAESPFNQLKLAPVKYCTAMNNSYFSKEYNEELLRQLVDNLNVLYVAFTRAENNLVVLTGQKGNSTVGAKADFVADIINTVLNGEEKNGQWTCLLEKGAEKTYTFGDIVPSSVREETSATAEKQTSTDEVNYLEPKFNTLNQPFKSLRAAMDFRQSNESARFLRGELGDDEEDKGRFVEEGNFYHSLLERIQVLDDLPRVITEFEREGLIAGAEHKHQVEEYMQRIFENEQAREWFSPKWRVLNERNILLPLTADKTKRFERPDRVICDGNTTIVIDYKTGGTKSLLHQNQVNDYMELLSQMGYPNPQGFVWYLKYNEIQPVAFKS